MAYPYLAPGARLLAVKLKDQQNNPIGEVKEWLMDVDEGRVVFVLASLSESGDQYTAIPWPLMKADREHGGYQVAADTEKLQSAPQISLQQLNDLLTDKPFLDKIYQHYQVNGYWQGEQSTKSELDLPPKPAPEEGEAQPNDLKERKDETGKVAQGQTVNSEHGEGTGYGG